MSSAKATNRELQQAEHQNIQDNYGAKRAVMFGFDGDDFNVVKVNTDGSLLNTDGDYSINIQEKSDDINITYVGIAEIGSDTDESVWRIYRINETAGTVIEWADGNNNFDNVFDDRESLTYS